MCVLLVCIWKDGTGQALCDLRKIFLKLWFLGRLQLDVQ